MLTPQQVQEKGFTKAFLNGYDAVAVDDFLEELTQDYTTLHKENATLKSKIKILVEKVEEYRVTENSMRMALYNAQKMGNDLIEEAKRKSDTMLTETELEADKRASAVARQIAEEQERLDTARQETSAFSQKVLKLIADEKAFMEKLSQLVLDNAAPSLDMPATTPTMPIATPKQVAPKMADIPQTPPLDLSAVNNPAPNPTSIPTETVAAEKAETASPEIAVTEFHSDTPTSTEPADPVVEDKISAFFDSFDTDKLDQTFEQTEEAAKEQVTTARALEKNEIAADISASMGDTSPLRIDPTKLDEDENSMTTKRPRLNFDDLEDHFGKNL